MFPYVLGYVSKVRGNKTDHVGIEYTPDSQTTDNCATLPLFWHCFSLQDKPRFHSTMSMQCSACTI